MYILDSNILIGHLNGDKKIERWIDKQRNDKEYLAISTISKIEVLSLKELKDSQIEQIEQFLDVFEEINLYGNITNLAAALRRKENITLGDAIILASALSRKAHLVTNDKKLLQVSKKFVTAHGIPKSPK